MKFPDEFEMVEVPKGTPVIDFGLSCMDLRQLTRCLMALETAPGGTIVIKWCEPGGMGLAEMGVYLAGLALAAPNLQKQIEAEKETWGWAT